MKERKELTVLNFKKFPKDLRNQFKAICAAQGKDMQDVIIDVIANYIKKYKEEQEK